MKRLIPLLIILSVSLTVQGQFKKNKGAIASKPSQQSKFLEKQWWLGFKAGTNFSQPSPIKRYTVTTPTNYAQALNDKVYDSFSKTGSQATLEATFYFKGFSFSTQPTYRQSRFSYTNQFQWRNPENSAEHLVLKYDQEQNANYADFPLLIKYDILRGKLRPYVQVGVFYSLLINANKSIKISGTDYASGGINQFSNQEIIVGAKDLFHNYWGIMGGAGLGYNLGNVKVVLDASYWKSMSNISNTSNRFSNDRLTGVGDAQDDLDLNNIVISAGVLFPMRFLSNSFKTLDR
ncbi:MAG: outer membrane beta-barrel protein [Cyclobacteriaceae bacterium]|nr:outer membrane beta-barrel protein [Cyclobacteriaceae bacterium]